MTMDAATLRRLSSLLDRAFELSPAERQGWLDGLAGDDAGLVPTLRDLLARPASKEATDYFLFRPSAFTIVDGESAASGPAADDVVGAYRLERLLGRGGMGEVWLAGREDGGLKRKVALKLPHVSWSPAFAERFARERDILATLEHPHIARLYDAGVDRRGRPFMALEYVEGKPLDVFCREGALSIDARLRLLLQVADAVAFAHSRLVLHRDLKPANLLVTADGNVRLLDFGIAKLMEGERTQETQLTRLAGQLTALTAIQFLEMHHSLYGQLVLTENRNPFLRPALISGGAIAVLSVLLTPRLGIWGMLLSTGFVQACFNNWWPIGRAIRGLDLTVRGYARYFFSFSCHWTKA